MQLIKWVLSEIVNYFKTVWIKLLAQLAIFCLISLMYILSTRILPKRIRVQRYKFKQVIEKLEEMSEYVPNGIDTPIQVVVKANGLFNQVLNANHNEIEDPHWDFKSLIEDKRPEFEVKTDDEFTSTYLPTVANFADSVKVLGTLNKNEYVIEYLFKVREKEIPIVAISTQETLANTKSFSGKSSISREAFEDVFAFKKGDDPYSIINILFEKVSNKLHLFADNNGNIQISPVSHGYDQKHYLVDEPFILDLETRIKKFKDKNMQRTIMLWGPPGTGKSLFVLTLADRTSGRVLKIDSSFIKQFNENKMLKHFCLKIEADLIVLDDVDHFITGLDQNQTFLYILESLKTIEHKTTVMMTVNDIKKLNAAILRPGRVDEIIQFKEPNESYRLDFIKRLLVEKLGEPNPNQEHIERLSKAVKGMTQAYIKEWVEFYLIEDKDIEKVIAAITQRKKIMKTANISLDEEMD